jgi:hypothetical protein
MVVKLGIDKGKLVICRAVPRVSLKPMGEAGPIHGIIPLANEPVGSLLVNSVHRHALQPVALATGLP